jgi:predicted cupin superfamily sugar epimerase
MAPGIGTMPTSNGWVLHTLGNNSVAVPAEEKEFVRIAEEHFAASTDQIVAESDSELRYARRDPTGHFVSFESRGNTAEQLDLLPHPEGGWYRRTWETAARVSPAGYVGERPTATAIYFLLRPGESSRWHRVRSDELYLWHRGELTVWLDSVEYVLGPDRPQLLIPGGTWQQARAGDTEALISCVVSPGFDFADFAVRD